MNYPLMIIFLVFCSVAVNAHAVECGVKATYEGKGAGEVIFDGPLHSSKGLTCEACHESKGLLPALFEMKTGGSQVTMRKIELGRSCGYCHKVSADDFSSCSQCHHK